MKIDTNCDGTVDWDEFCTYMLLEYKERQDMNYVNETPFPNPFRLISNPHRNSVVGTFHINLFDYHSNQLNGAWTLLTLQELVLCRH